MKRSTRVKISPPDGGMQAWIVVFASFVCNGIIFGIINTYSVIYVEFYNKMLENGINDASSKASLIGSLTIGTTFLFSPLSGILIDRIGIQMTTFIGGALAATALFLSSLLTEKVGWLFLTYGLLFGIGSSLTYTPSLAILGHYFKKYLGIVNGIVTAGSSLFTIIMPFFLDSILKSGLNYCLRIEALLLCLLMACSFAFKPLYKVTKSEGDDRLKLVQCVNAFVNIKVWRNKKYIIWATAVPIALIGYFVPYVHVVKYVEDNFPKNESKLPVVCIAVSSGIGKLVFGRISDFKKGDRIVFQQFSFLVIGILTISIPFVSVYNVLLLMYLVMGLFDGCFVSMIGPIAFDLCGPEGAAQGIGFLLGLCSIPLTIGPPIAGLMYDHNKSYMLPFILAGIPPIIGVIILFMIRFISSDENDCSDIPETRETERLSKSEVMP